MKKTSISVAIVSAVFFLFMGSSYVSADSLVWESSEAAAFSSAKSQGKKILLFAGREACGNCRYMKYTVCESSSPPIRSLIDQYFVPWFCPIDTSDEWSKYASGLGSFSLPMICVIDPNDSGQYSDRTTGVQEIGIFYDRLSKYIPSPCFAADDKLAIGISCALYQGIQYGFKLNYSSVPDDPIGFYWKMDTSTVSQFQDNTAACMSVSSDLKLPICAEYHGSQYEFMLNFTPVSKDTMDIYWKMDISTFKERK